MPVWNYIEFLLSSLSLPLIYQILSIPKNKRLAVKYSIHQHLVVEGLKVFPDCIETGRQFHEFWWSILELDAQSHIYIPRFSCQSNDLFRGKTRSQCLCLYCRNQEHSPLLGQGARAGQKPRLCQDKIKATLSLLSPHLAYLEEETWAMNTSCQLPALDNEGARKNRTMFFVQHQTLKTVQPTTSLVCQEINTVLPRCVSTAQKPPLLQKTSDEQLSDYRQGIRMRPLFLPPGRWDCASYAL